MTKTVVRLGVTKWNIILIDLLFKLIINILFFISEPVRAACPEVCPKIFKPVCGTDGVSYNNECIMLMENCGNERSVTVDYKGKCRKFILLISIKIM